MTGDRPQNEVVENILDIIIFLTVIILMLLALPFYTAYVYTRLGIRKLKNRLGKLINRV
jgi:hypothetical protein